MGSIYKRGNMLWCRYKDHSGKWTQGSSGFKVGQEKEARAALKKLERHATAEREVLAKGATIEDALALNKDALTVARWVRTWQPTRGWRGRGPGVG